MRTRWTGCLVAAVVILALFTTAAGVFGPGLLRQAREIYAPISKLKDSQQSFEAWSKQQGWHEPAEPSLTPEQLDRFLTLRKELHDLDADAPRPRREPGGPRPTFRDVTKVMGGVSGFVSARLEAFRRAGMTTAEYHYLERLVYRRWLSALKTAGHDPAVEQQVAREISDLARAETDPSVAARLRGAADRVRQRRPEPPDGVPRSVHDLLLAHAGRIEGLSAAVRALADAAPD